MKNILAIALVSAMTLPAFAQSQYDYDYNEEIQVERNGARYVRRGDGRNERRDERYDERYDQRDEQHDHNDPRDHRETRRRRGGSDASVIIGGIIGAIINSGVIDNDHSRRGYRGQVTCFAENRRGERFRARGHRPRFVQDAAVRACYNYGSRQCYAIGCRTDRWN